MHKPDTIDNAIRRIEAMRGNALNEMRAAERKMAECRAAADAYAAALDVVRRTLSVMETTEV